MRPAAGCASRRSTASARRLLAAFPVEAGLVPGFRPLDAREEAVLAREALAEMLVDAEREGRDAADRRGRRAEPAAGRGRGRGVPARLRACAPRRWRRCRAGIQPFLRRALDLPARRHRRGDRGAAAATTRSMSRALRAVAAANAAWGTGNRGRSAPTRSAMWLTLPPASAGAAAGASCIGAGLTRQGRAALVRQGPSAAGARLCRAGDARSHGRCGELLAMQALAPSYADLLARGLEAGRDYAADLWPRPSARGGAVDFDDLIRAHRRAARASRAWANGCATSSTRRPTMS